MKKIKLLFLFILISISNLGQEVMVDSISQNYSGEYYPEYETPYGEDRPKTEFHNRHLDENFKDDYKSEKFNYDRIVKRKEPEINPPSFRIPVGFLEILMYAILGIVILLIIYYIIKSAGGIYFGNEKRKIKYDTSEESSEEDLDEIANNDFEKLIQRAKSEQDYRKAIRYYYLWVLQKLTDRNHIKWHKDKTDFDYLQELKNQSIKEKFSANTYIYDHIWYGNFELNPQEFELAESIFQQTLKQIN